MCVHEYTGSSLFPDVALSCVFGMNCYYQNDRTSACLNTLHLLQLIVLSARTKTPKTICRYALRAQPTCGTFIYEMCFLLRFAGLCRITNSRVGARLVCKPGEFSNQCHWGTRRVLVNCRGPIVDLCNLFCLALDVQNTVSCLRVHPSSDK